MDGIRGSYQLEHKIETGGSATVWAASHIRSGRRVALKALHPHLIDDDLARNRFTTEADVMLGLDHPNVVETFEYTEDAQGPFLVMELLGGRNLQRLIEQNGRFDPMQAARIAAAAAAGLAYAHARGIVHRDIKPANIVLDGDRVVIVDFGIAASPDLDQRMAIENNVIGTLPYMAPERALGEPGDKTTDVYALGMVLYEMLTGVVPYTGRTPSEVAIAQQQAEPKPPSDTVAVPTALEVIVLRCLRRNARDRFHSADDLLIQLDGFVSGATDLPTVTMDRADLIGPRYGRTRRPSGIRRGRRKALVRRGPTYAAVGSITTLLGTWIFGL